MNRCSSCGFARLALAGAEGRGDGPLPGARKVPCLAHRVLPAWFCSPRSNFLECLTSSAARRRGKDGLGARVQTNLPALPSHAPAQPHILRPQH